MFALLNSLVSLKALIKLIKVTNLGFKTAILFFEIQSIPAMKFLFHFVIISVLG